jgi:antitoxin VapB
MGMNIKDPRVHAMARELAARRGSSVTEAVRRALASELERCEHSGDEQNRAAKLEAVRHIAASFGALPLRDPRSVGQIRADLYDERGLPV